MSGKGCGGGSGGQGTNDALIQHLKQCCGLGERPEPFVCAKNDNNNNSSCASSCAPPPTTSCAPPPTTSCAPKSCGPSSGSGGPNFVIPPAPCIDATCNVPPTETFCCPASPPPPACAPKADPCAPKVDACAPKKEDACCAPPPKVEDCASKKEECAGSGYKPPTSCPCAPPPAPVKVDLTCNVPPTATFCCPPSPPPPPVCAPKADACAPKKEDKKC